MIGGGFLAWHGYQEVKLGAGAKAEPAEVALAEVLPGSKPENAHLKIGPHSPIWYLMVFEYEAESAGEEISAGSKINHLYVPIVPQDHPYLRAMDVAQNEEDLPPAPDVAMILKTKKYKTYGALPEELYSNWDGVQGVVINEIEKIGDEEMALLREGFPQLQADKVLVLEEGRKPTSPMAAYGIVAGGIVLAFAGVGGLAAGRRQ